MKTGLTGGIGRTRTRVCLTALALLPLLAIGCSNEKVAMEQLQRENEELRDREAQLQAALNDCEDRNLASEDERARLEAMLASSPQRTPTSTGFEGISGANTSLRGSDIVVDVAGDVLFASGSVSLKGDSQRTLDQIASVIQRQYSGNEIQIAGHTDSDPIRKSQWKSNERLSAERALAVEDYLASKGVSKDQMHISGYGPAKPRGSKKDSRRVEIIIMGN